jgi:hypothetical protein
VLQEDFRLLRAKCVLHTKEITEGSVFTLVLLLILALKIPTVTYLLLFLVLNYRSILNCLAPRQTKMGRDGRATVTGYGVAERKPDYGY